MTSYQCINCNKKFSRSDNLKRHKSTVCKNKETEILKDVLHEVKKLRQENVLMLSEIKILKDSLQKDKKIRQDSDSILPEIRKDVLNSQLKLVYFGEEEMYSKIDESVYMKLFSAPLSAVCNLVDYIHFNETIPEYHNCYISNLRDNHGIVYDENKWKLIDQNELIENIYYEKSCLLERKFEEIYGLLDKEIRTDFSDFLNMRSELMNSQKKDIKLLLYNNRHIIKNKNS